MTDVNLLLNPAITGTEAVPSLFSVFAITVPGILMGFFITKVGPSEKHKP
jgi:hypothetical protein